MASDQFTPTALANQALDAAGIEETLGDIQEGSRAAAVCLRAYSECFRQMLRGVMWDFARKEAPLLLLADATGQTAGVGTQVPGSRFIYEYAYPTDCAKLRYVPFYPFLTPAAPSSNIQPANPSSPIVDNLGQPPYMGQRQIPAPFLITSDANYIPAGTSNETAGISPLGRTVILTNVIDAKAIYTYDALYPNVWDHAFRAAMVAYLASEIAFPLNKDKRLGMQIRDTNIKIAQGKIQEARVSNGNEGWSSSDLTVDWIRTRMIGGGYGSWNGNGWSGCGSGMWSGGYDAVSFANGSSF